jgi:CheY-like chemotaxis protein
VAQRLLGQEGADITLAENGALGVQAVTDMQPAYDAVLMDLQMPVMDGFEATRAIRQDLGLTQLPIIAMTANARPSDRAACLAAGMNDHVGKPFELDHLVATLHKHTGFVPAQGASVVPETLPAPTPVAAAAQDYPPGDLDMAGALQRVGGDEDIFSTVLQAFAKDMAQVPAQVQAHLAAEERVQAARALHTLKGLAATVGARHLSAVAARLEHQVKSGSPAHEHDAMLETLRQAIHALSQTLTPVLMRYALAQAVPVQDVAQMPALDRVKLRQDLTTLAGLLENSNLMALGVHNLVQQTFGPQLPQELKPLKEAMALLDFAGARVLCEGLIQSHCT